MKRLIGYKTIIILMVSGISVLHYFTDSSDLPIHSFYRLLYFIPIILAAFKYGFKGGTVTSLAVGVIYSPFALLSLNTLGWQILKELLDVILFFAVGIVTGILVEKKNSSLLKLEDELKRYILLEGYTKGIINSIKSGVISVNTDMLITMINCEAKRILNINYDCIGQNFLEIFACCEEVKRKVSDGFYSNKPSPNIEIYSKESSIERIIKIGLFPLNFENVNKGAVIIVDDITEMKKLEQQLQRNEKLAALGELAAGVAHEIRNPLGIIKAIAQTMKNELKENTEAVGELEIIDEEVERTNKVIKALMDFGKPGKGQKASCNLNNILDEVLTVTGKYFSQYSIYTVFEPSDIGNVNIDTDQIKQAFINIIFNAVQAMPQGGKLIISTANIGSNTIKVSFSDTGIGIDEKDLNSIFNPFFTTKPEGTGLGLSIVNRIVEENNGVINVYSKVGRGSTFEILFHAEEG
ncbi:MAG: ATP-binding protein [Clostridia bacterium]|nr:ATP-binding protein [Clostridia bacterium]